jgi:hypothetical protein
VDPTFRALPESFTEADIVSFVESHNLRRRDLSPPQKAAIYIELHGMRLKEETRERRQFLAGNLRNAVPSTSARAVKPGATEDKIAKGAGVGTTTATKVLAVQRMSPRLFEEIKAGTISADDAYTQVRANKQSSDDRKPKAPKTVMLKTHDGTEVPYPLAASKPTFNRTNEQISWAAWSWNPVTGCLHGCRYLLSLPSLPSTADEGAPAQFLFRLRLRIGRIARPCAQPTGNPPPRSTRARMASCCRACA